MKALSFFLLALLPSCVQDHGELNRYNVSINKNILKGIEKYRKISGFNKKTSFITVNWGSFYNGKVVYISKSRVHPSIYNRYPVFWSYADSTLIFVYDDKSNFRLTDSIQLKKEVDYVILSKKINLYAKDSLITEDDISLRFFYSGTEQKMDTSKFYIKFCNDGN